MDHEVFEKEMIDGVNRHAESKDKHSDSTPVKSRGFFTKEDTSALKCGLRRTLVALITAALFALSVWMFIEVAHAVGYVAVVLFLSAIVLMIAAFGLLYAQGVVLDESKGDDK